MHISKDYHYVQTLVAPCEYVDTPIKNSSFMEMENNKKFSKYLLNMHYIGCNYIIPLEYKQIILYFF